MRHAGRRTLFLGVALVAVLGVVWARREAHGLRNALSVEFWNDRLKGTADYDPSRNYLRHGDRSRAEVALTFDDGPHPESASRILDVLAQKGVKATFFLVGSRVKEHPELVRRMLAEGHVVGNHTQDHLRLTQLRSDQIESEIRNCAVNLERATGREGFEFFRPPGMRFDQRVLEVIRKDGYTMVGWSDAAKDFISVEHPHADSKLIERRIADQVENGSLVLLHDIPATADVLARVIDEIRARGFRFVTVREMRDRLLAAPSASSGPRRGR